ncbi:MAG: hypothetical protein F6K28_26780 [Microcoleus sp. SIO2G3]|nr:hypothetical protein [Microcoleus sp. SIO2G3]
MIVPGTFQLAKKIDAALMPSTNQSQDLAQIMDAIADGSYAPLSRPLFIYVKKEAAARPEVKALVDFALAADNKELISESGYVPLPDDAVALVKSRFEQGKVGSAFGGKEAVGVTIKELLEKEK